MSLRTRLDGNNRKDFPGIPEPIRNFGNESYGRVDLVEATQKSINTAFVDLTRQMGGGKDGDITQGAEKVLEAAAEAGIPQSVVDKIEPFAVTPLGYAPVPPVDMANAYATIAAQGKKADWYIIQKVTDQNGAQLHQHKNENERTISEDVAADTIAAMRSVIEGGTGTNGRTICPTAGKTGTATAGPDDDQHVSSSWFAGYTPKLATAVMYNKGVGNEDLEGYLNPFYGGTYPAMTFKAYMDAALEGSDCGTFPKPANIKADKGTIYTPPPPKCGADERLNDATTRCVEKPTPTPTPTPTAPTPTTPTTPAPDCDKPIPDPGCPPDDPNNGGTGKPGKPDKGWAWILPLSLLTLVPRREDELRPE
jgi:membrane peptidoglycan carboxypeptidase